MSNISTLLSRISVFSDLDQSELEAIAPLLTLQSFKRGETLIGQWDNSSSVYFLCEGSARATMYSPAGKEVSYQELQPGEMLGEIAALDNLPRSTHVIALTKGEALVLSSEDFNRLLVEYPSVAKASLLKMVGLVRFLCDRIFEYSTLSVGGRVKAELLRLAKQQAPQAKDTIVIENMPTHEELAGRLATHREAITRELGQLEKNGIIEKGRSRITILDMAALEGQSS